MLTHMCHSACLFQRCCCQSSVDNGEQHPPKQASRLHSHLFAARNCQKEARKQPASCVAWPTSLQPATTRWRRRHHGGRRPGTPDKTNRLSLFTSAWHNPDRACTCRSTSSSQGLVWCQSSAPAPALPPFHTHNTTPPTHTHAHHTHNSTECAHTFSCCNNYPSIQQAPTQHTQQLQSLNRSFDSHA